MAGFYQVFGNGPICKHARAHCEYEGDVDVSCGKVKDGTLFCVKCKDFEPKCDLSANDEPFEDISQSRGDIVRSMTDLQLAYWMVYISAHNGDSGHDLRFLWCDGHGPCMGGEACRDSWNLNCALRYLICKAPDIEIPQQPKMRIRDHGEIFTKTFACPSCGKRLCSYTFGQAWTDNGLQLSQMHELRLCPNCKQAIDLAGQVIANRRVANETTDD